MIHDNHVNSEQPESDAFVSVFLTIQASKLPPELTNCTEGAVMAGHEAGSAGSDIPGMQTQRVGTPRRVAGAK